MEDQPADCQIENSQNLKLTTSRGDNDLSLQGPKCDSNPCEQGWNHQLQQTNNVEKLASANVLAPLKVHTSNDGDADKAGFKSRDTGDDNEGKSEEKVDTDHHSPNTNNKENNQEETKYEHMNGHKDSPTKVSDSISMPRPPNVHSSRKQSEEESKSKINRVPISQWRSRSVSDYDFLGLIGKGTFGKVFKAKLKHPSNLIEDNEIVALKKLNMAKEEEGFPITALREIQILKKLKHKNVVHLKDIVVNRCKLDISV